MPAYHYSSSSSAPRNRSSPAIRKVPRQMAAVKMRTHNQRPRLLTVLRSRRATRHPLSWTAKLIPRSTCLSKDGSSWRSPSLSFYPGTIGYCGTWNCTCREMLTASEWELIQEAVRSLRRKIRKEISQESEGNFWQFLFMPFSELLCFKYEDKYEEKKISHKLSMLQIQLGKQLYLRPLSPYFWMMSLRDQIELLDSLILIIPFSSDFYDFFIHFLSVQIYNWRLWDHARILLIVSSKLPKFEMCIAKAILIN